MVWTGMGWGEQQMRECVMADRAILFLYDVTSNCLDFEHKLGVRVFCFSSVPSMETSTAIRPNTNLDDGAKEARHGILSL